MLILLQNADKKDLLGCDKWFADLLVMKIERVQKKG